MQVPFGFIRVTFTVCSRMTDPSQTRLIEDSPFFGNALSELIQLNRSHLSLLAAFHPHALNSHSVHLARLRAPCGVSVLFQE